jgi:hypothetical protein
MGTPRPAAGGHGRRDCVPGGGWNRQRIFMRGAAPEEYEHGGGGKEHRGCGYKLTRHHREVDGGGRAADIQAEAHHQRRSPLPASKPAQ